MNQKILICCMNTDRRNVLRRIAQKNKIQIVDVKTSEYNQQIGYLAGITGFKRQNAGKSGVGEGRKISREMVIFCGMNSQQVDEFLNAWKNSGESAIELKAMVTFTNIFWNPLMLYTELLKEHAAFQ